MKKSDLKPGTQVLASVDSDEYDGGGIVKFYFDEYDDYTLTGVVMDKDASPNHVWVKWDESDFSEYDEEEVEVELLTLASERNSIEADFKAATKEVKQKMKDAAKLIKEANSIALDAHAKSLADMYDAVSPLIDAMDNAGWRSSSWGC
jgi:uncharacterized protein YwqG